MCFYLLVLNIYLNFYLDISYKQDRFFDVLVKKNFEFVIYKKNDIVLFNLSLVLLLAKVNSISKKQKLKKNI